MESSRGSNSAKSNILILKHNQQADDLSAWGIEFENGPFNRARSPYLLCSLFRQPECNLYHPTLISSTLSPTSYEYLVEILDRIIAILVLIFSTFFVIGRMSGSASGPSLRGVGPQDAEERVRRCRSCDSLILTSLIKCSCGSGIRNPLPQSIPRCCTIWRHARECQDRATALSAHRDGALCRAV